MQNYAERFPNQIRCIKHKTNRRLPSALNTGFANSKGDFLTWTSDDNFFKEDALEKMAFFLINNPFVGLVYCDFFLINASSQITGTQKVKEFEEIINKNIIGPCFMYRQIVYKEIGKYNKKAILAEDYDYWLRIASKYKIAPLHEYLYYYRIHDLSLSSTKKREVIKATSDKVIAINIFKLPWFSKDQKYCRMEKIIKSAINRRDYVKLPLFFFISFAINPKSTSKQIANYFIKLFKSLRF